MNLEQYSNHIRQSDAIWNRLKRFTRTSPIHTNRARILPHSSGHASARPKITHLQSVTVYTVQYTVQSYTTPVKRKKSIKTQNITSKFQLTWFVSVRNDGQDSADKYSSEEETLKSVCLKIVTEFIIRIWLKLAPVGSGWLGLVCFTKEPRRISEMITIT